MHSVKLAQIRRYALSLPEVTEQAHFHFGSFRVKGKIFVTLPPEGEHIHIFVADEVREQALAMHPDVVEKLLWGGKVVGVRVALETAPAVLVRQLVRQAWTGKAPKSLLLAAARLNGSRSGD